MNTIANISGAEYEFDFTDGQPPPQPLRILVVDDDRDMRELYLNILTGPGYQVDAAKDGDEGWNALRRVKENTENYRLLITDQNMPILTGVELVTKLRAASVAIPVILASAAPPANTASLQLSAILLKPFSPDDLLVTVKEALDGNLSNHVTPRMRNFARRLLAYEALFSKKAKTSNHMAFPVTEKLGVSLVNFIGFGAYHSLLSRALALAGADVPWLLTLTISPEGSLNGLEELNTKVNVQAAKNGEVILTAYLFTLLRTFIGSSLTQQLLSDIWPHMDEFDF